MPISRERLLKLRPYLFHLTAATNVERILRARRLESTAAILAKAGRSDLVRTRRREHVHIELDGERVQLRDQAPLYAGNLALDAGWTFDDFVEHLNARVFFWPGGSAGPISYGLRHYQKYSTEKPAILRIPTAALLADNPDRPPHFCRYNSGSPRCSNGLKSPRTARTFIRGEDAAFGACDIVEVTFVGEVRLPAQVDVARVPQGPWQAR